MGSGFSAAATAFVPSAFASSAFPLSFAAFLPLARAFFFPPASAASSSSSSSRPRICASISFLMRCRQMSSRAAAVSGHGASLRL